MIPEKLIYGQALSISLISLQIFAVMQLFPWFFDRIDGKYIVHTQMFDKFYLGQTLEKKCRLCGNEKRLFFLNLSVSREILVKCSLSYW